MAYPFAKAPTVADLIERLTDKCQASLHTTSPIIGPQGEITPRYLKRQAGGTLFVSEPLPDDDDAKVGWDKLRRVCAQLRVDPKDLEIPGLHLG